MKASVRALQRQWKALWGVRKIKDLTFERV